MSDHVVKLIPNDPSLRVPEERARTVEAYLNTLGAERVEVKRWETPVFVDCGGNLERILCPLCGKELSFDWWGEAMEKSSGTGFQSLEVLLPCCGGSCSLNDLHYYFPCGFARVEFDLLEPRKEVSKEQVERIMGCPVRLIHAHY